MLAGNKANPGHESKFAESTLRRFAEHALRLYERERGRSESQALLGEYARRWQRWAAAGLGQLFLVQAHSYQAQ
jgi:hypothetical protein